MNDIKDSFLSTLVFLTRFPVKIKFNYIAKSDNILPGYYLRYMIHPWIYQYLSHKYPGQNIASVLRKVEYIRLLNYHDVFQIEN